MNYQVYNNVVFVIVNFKTNHFQADRHGGMFSTWNFEVRH